MKTVLKYSLIGLTCLSLAGCFGGKKKNTRRARAPSAHQIGFQAYKAGKTLGSEIQISAPLHKDLTQAQYTGLTRCLDEQVGLSTQSKLGALIAMLGVNYEAYHGCCKNQGLVSHLEADHNLTNNLQMTMIDLGTVLGTLRNHQIVPDSEGGTALSTDLKQAYLTYHDFPKALWIYAINSNYNEQKIINRANQSTRGGTAQLGASRPASQGSDWQHGGIIGPDKATLISYIETSPSGTVSLNNLAIWYYNNYQFLPAGAWLEDFTLDVFSNVLLEAIWGKSDSKFYDASLKNTYLTQITDNEARATTNAARDFLDQPKDKAISNLLNQILWFGWCRNG